MSLNAMDCEELRQLFARLARNIDHGGADAYAPDNAPDGGFSCIRTGIVSQSGATLSGRCHDRLVKLSGSWLIQERPACAGPRPGHPAPSPDILDEFVARARPVMASARA
jgi:hypothetical protein